jgi:hypothetical protein
VSRQYDGARRVAVLESQERVLLTWGFFRPRIIVPAEAASWTAERIAIVLAHEFAHIARRDWALAIAAQMVCAVHWFNPLIWMTCRRLRDESEQACDDSVLRRGVNAADYASHLVAVARHLLAGGGGWTAATAVASPSTLERRIASMLNASHDRRPATRVVRAVAVVTMLAVAATVASVTLTEPFAPALSARSPRYDVRLPAPPALPVVSAPDTRRDVARSDSRTRAEPTQQIPASVSGVVRDASGAVMPGVDLTMTDKSAGTSRSIATDSNGRFVFRNLQPSRYELSARLPGFASTVLDLTLAGGQDLQRDVVMRIGGITESISVVCPAGAAAVPRGAADGTILAGLDAATTRLFAIWRSMDVMPTLAAQAPVRVGGQLTAPQKTTHVAPRCPDSSPPAGGLVVVLETVIGVDGRVQNIRSLRPPLSGDVVVQSVRSQNGTWEIRSMRPVAAGSQAEFVIAAMEAVVQWVYTPTRLNNDPTAVIMTATVTFSPPK